MRKHRLFGVVIAAFIGVGVFTHGSNSPHRTPGAERADMQLAAAKVAVSPDPTSVPTTDGGDAADGLHVALLHQLVSDVAVNLSSPFTAESLVWDIHAAQLTERAQESAYLGAVAQSRAEAKAYLVAIAAARPRPAPVVAVVRPSVAAVTAPGNPWAALRQCESGGNYAEDTGNGYYGAYQFAAGTWQSLGLSGLPNQASPAQQDQAAQELQARRGWGQWPSCARRLGLL